MGGRDAARFSWPKSGVPSQLARRPVPNGDRRSQRAAGNRNASGRVARRPDGSAWRGGARNPVDGGAGTDAPSMIAARRVLAGVFGFEALRPDHEAVIEALPARDHVLTVMPTDSGKSLCVQVPALIGDSLTVLVSPLMAQIQDQVAALKPRASRQRGSTWATTAPNTWRRGHARRRARCACSTWPRSG